MPIRPKTYKNKRQRLSAMKRVFKYEEEEKDEITSSIEKANVYSESFINPFKRNFLQPGLMRTLKVPEKYMKVLIKECDYKKQKMLKASLYGVDGTDKGYHPEYRKCLRHTWRQRTLDGEKINYVTSIVQKMLTEELYELSEDNITNLLRDENIPLSPIVDTSHFDIIRYVGNGAKFLPHRDKVKYKEGYVQYSLVICLDSHITTMNAGATCVYYCGRRHIFNESIMPGHAVLFRSEALHSSERLMNDTDMKLILKFDVHIPEPPRGIFTESLCTCTSCNPYSSYNKKIYTYSVFHGKHKKLPSDIINLIGSFRGKFLKCSCPYARGNKVYNYESCECSCKDCGEFQCKYHPFYDEYAFENSYYPSPPESYYGSWCNGD